MYINKRFIIAVAMALCLFFLAGTAYAQVTCVITSEDPWDNGYVLQLEVTNSGSTAITGWSVTLEFNQPPNVTNEWNTVTSPSGNTLTASNTGYNGYLEPGGKIQFGFQGTHNGNYERPEITSNNDSVSDDLIIQENEPGFNGVDGTIDNAVSGYTGDGYANTDNAAGNGIYYKVNIPADGNYTLEFRYFNYWGDKPADVIIDGTTAGSIAFLVSSSWTTDSLDVYLTAGETEINLIATSDNGLANIDVFTIIQETSDILTGHLTSPDTQGLSYATETQSGVTAVDGGFTYKDGESITFSIGDIIIGETVPAKSEMTPLDLVPTAVLYTTNTQVQRVLFRSILAPEHIVFNKLTNIIVLLQNLDDDGNPGNGISINSGWTGALSQDAVNFGDDIRIFLVRGNPSLQRILTLGTAAGLRSTGAIRKPGKALDFFYAEQGVATMFTVAERVDTEFPVHRDLPMTGPKVITYDYDNNGNMLTYSYDVEETSQNPDMQRTYTWDDDGNLLEMSEDHDMDGIPDTVRTYTYNLNGKISVIAENNSERSDSWIYHYKDSGQLWTMTRGLGIGSYNFFMMYYVYDDNGNISFERWGMEEDTHNGWDKLYTIDSNGNRERFDQEYNNNGNLRGWIYDYNDDGFLISEGEDPDMQADPILWTYSWDGNGNLTERTVDYESDGLEEYIYTYFYDSFDSMHTEIITYQWEPGSPGDIFTSDTEIYYTAGNANWTALLNALWRIAGKELTKFAGPKYSPEIWEPYDFRLFELDD